MCGHVKNSSGKQMSLFQYESILRQARNLRLGRGRVDHIRFDGNREALLHPDSGTMMKMTRDYGYSLGIVTNGVLMTPQRALSIVEYADSINISVTGITPEVYYRFQGSQREGCAAQLDRVIENVTNLVKQRERTRSRLKITVSYIATFDSVCDIKNAMFFWKNIGVDLIGVFDDINETVDRIRNAPKTAIAYHPGGMCLNAPVISASGEVFPCCQPPGEYMSLGNCFEMDLCDIFTSDRYYRFYKNLAELDANTLPAGCRTCGVIASMKRSHRDSK
jgi:radical SAM protein with 4Fe4S-binding SPASM domain